MLDPFVLTLVPTARAVRTVRHQGHDRTAPSPQPPEAAEPASAGESASTEQPASARERVDASRAPDSGQSARGGDGEPADDDSAPISPEQVRDHLRRRAIFLRELAEARELRERVTPHRSRRARIHAALRRRTFRVN